MTEGLLVLESGEVFSGLWQGGSELSGEVVFNTSHAGYEEIATDPSYYSQIVVMTASQMGNYGANRSVWESRKIWIRGFVCLEIQNSLRERSWVQSLAEYGIPVLSGVQTRELVLRLRDGGVCRGALVAKRSGESTQESTDRGLSLCAEMSSMESDWAYAVSQKKEIELDGLTPTGPRVAVLDFGCKQNIIRELQKRCSKVKIFPSRTIAQEILNWNPDGVLLSNGPGDPQLVQESVETIKELLGKRYLFGICMGHQLLARAIGAKTYKLKFGHRGGNHPVKDLITNRIYMTSQNHGYAVDAFTLPPAVRVSHINLNDQSVSGIIDVEGRFLGVQFHPENCPGPREAEQLFDDFIGKIKNFK